MIVSIRHRGLISDVRQEMLRVNQDNGEGSRRMHKEKRPSYPVFFT